MAAAYAHVVRRGPAAVRRRSSKLRAGLSFESSDRLPNYLLAEVHHV